MACATIENARRSSASFFLKIRIFRAVQDAASTAFLHSFPRPDPIGVRDQACQRAPRPPDSSAHSNSTAAATSLPDAEDEPSDHHASGTLTPAVPSTPRPIGDWRSVELERDTYVAAAAHRSEPRQILVQMLPKQQ